MKTDYNNLLLIFVLIAYTVLLFISIDFCYFWDNIQQTSNEAHFFYSTNFSTFPSNQLNSAFSFTGYHPPLMGIITAILWKVIGYHLWVSHVFMYSWALILIFNLHKLVGIFFPEKYVGWVTMILLFEPTVLTQFLIASPDFILFTAFVISIRAIIEHKQLLLSVALLFLFGINMRGVFAGSVLLVSHILYLYYQSNFKISFINILKNLVAYLPILLLLSAYYISYFSINGWFFTNSAYTEHYTHPKSLIRIITHIAEFGLRSLENGRFLIWALGIYSFAISISNFKKWSAEIAFVSYLFSGLFSLYFLFVFITQMPFSSRYFMPFFLILSIIAIKNIAEKQKVKTSILIFITVLFLEISGNFWIYPDRIAKSWDTTLGHIPYYSLRKECFAYIDQQNINYNDIAAGFCLNGSRRIIELVEGNTKISSEPTKKYYIYSNISNVDDNFAVELQNTTKWRELKRFSKAFVFISIYQRI